MDEILKNVSKDRAFYLLISSFMVIAFVTALAVGDLKWFVPGVYFHSWAQMIPILLAYVVLYHSIQSLKSGTPVSKLLERLSAFFRGRASGFLLFSCIAVFHGTFTSLKSMLPELQPFVWDPAIADVDDLLHAGPAWIHVQFLNQITDLIRLLYSQVWFTLTIGVTFAACVAHPSQLRSQYIWTFLLCWSVLGIVIAGCFMSVGPVFYDRLLSEDRFLELTSRLTSLVNPNDYTSLYPDLLWTAYITKTAGMGTGISAFPSLHLAMSTLFFLVAYRLNRKLGWVMLGYLAITMLGSVHLGWHYAVDGYFSIIATTIIWKVVGMRLKAAKAQCEQPMPVWQPRPQG